MSFDAMLCCLVLVYVLLVLLCLKVMVSLLKQVKNTSKNISMFLYYLFNLIIHVSNCTYIPVS